MYKRMAWIGLLMGLPIFLIPRQSSSQTRTENRVEVAGAVQTAPGLVGGLSSTVVPEASTAAPLTEPPTTTAVTVPVLPSTVVTAVAVTSSPTTERPTTTGAPTTTVAPTSTTARPAPEATTGVAVTVTQPTSTTTTTETTLPPAPTSAATPAERGQAALAAIGYDWQGRLGGWTIDFSPGRDGVIGYTYTYEHRIEIFVRDDMSEGLLRHVIAHEIGHAVDVTLNSSSDRERWQDSRGIGASPWWPGNGVSDYSTGAGDFAECFAAWQVGTSVFRSKIAGVPSGDQLALVAELAAG